jgi:hypothetical protein
MTPSFEYSGTATSRTLAMHDHDGMIDQQKSMTVGLFFLIPIFPDHFFLNVNWFFHQDFCVEY